MSSNTLLGQFDLAALVVLVFAVWACIRPGHLGALAPKTKIVNISSYVILTGYNERQEMISSSFWRVTLVLEIGALLLASTVLGCIVVLHEMFLLKSPQIPTPMYIA